MNRRDSLLFYARNLTDQRVHRIVGKCFMEGSRQVENPEPEPTTPSIRTELAAVLLDLPDEAVTALHGLALDMKHSGAELLSAVGLFVSMWRAKALLEEQTKPDKGEKGTAQLVPLAASKQTLEPIEGLPTEGR